MTFGITPRTHPILPEMLRNNGLFAEESPLRSAPGILVFKRAHNYLQDGRALIDAGQPDKAVATLQKATIASPKYPEAWANLTLAHFLTNRDEDALAAAQRALHYRRTTG
jgi:tetratricopeptide (TPR) repeat protein